MIIVIGTTDIGSENEVLKTLRKDGFIIEDSDTSSEKIGYSFVLIDGDTVKCVNKIPHNSTYLFFNDLNEYLKYYRCSKNIPILYYSELRRKFISLYEGQETDDITLVKVPSDATHFHIYNDSKISFATYKEGHNYISVYNSSHTDCNLMSLDLLGFYVNISDYIAEQDKKEKYKDIESHSHSSKLSDLSPCAILYTNGVGNPVYFEDGKICSLINSPILDKYESIQILEGCNEYTVKYLNMKYKATEDQDTLESKIKSFLNSDAIDVDYAISLMKKAGIRMDPVLESLVRIYGSGFLKDILQKYLKK